MSLAAPLNHMAPGAWFMTTKLVDIEKCVIFRTQWKREVMSDFESIMGL